MTLIRQQLLQSWSGARQPAVPPRVAEAASAVAAYCAHDLDRQALSDRHLTLLFSRALSRAGEPEHALRLLVEEGAGPEHAASCLAVLDHGEGPWPAVDWLARRVYRASGFTAFGGGTCWMLDWDRVRPPTGPALEFAYADLLRRLVTEMAPFWNPTQGRGTLAHRGLSRHLALALEGKRAARLRWIREILESSRRLLAREALRRDWLHTPDCRLADAAY